VYSSAFIIQFNSNCLGTASLHNVSSKEPSFLSYFGEDNGDEKQKKMIGPESE
jgi:hypothetical protein